MRKILGPVLIGLGAFLLLAGILAATWAPGQVKRTPLDVDSVTDLTGEVAAVQTGGEPRQAKATSTTKSDSKAATDETAVFVNISCLMVDEGEEVPDCLTEDDDRLISASTDVFATDRKTALSVDSKALPDDAVAHDGLVNKWPFDAQKKTYPYWDGVLGEAVDAVYDRTEKVEGVDTYVYKVVSQDVPAEISDGIQGTYSSDKEIFVEPKTGSIIHQTDDQQRTLEDGTVALDLQLGFTPDQQKKNADAAKDNISTLNTLLKIVPIVGIVGGLLLIAGGVFLVLGNRRRGPGTATS